MAIGTNDAIIKKGTPKTLEASGASIANNTIAQADDASYSISSDGSNAPNAEFVLTCAYGTAPTENSTIALYARELNITGTSDADAPSATYKPRYIGVFIVDNVTTTQYLKLRAYDVPDEADYYLYNNTTGQTISAGWVLVVTPFTLGPAA